MAPLPVFVRGGPKYQRLEPDFLLLHKGVVMVVEVDGATVHRESPAEAHERVQGMQHAGVRVERVRAADCETPSKAAQCADRLMEAPERYREL
jgi:very-short-patch-repair endonuclease